MWASVEDVSKILRFLLTPDTKISHSKGPVSSHFMPDSTRRRVNCAPGAVIPLVGAFLDV
eukprot:331167-Amphidinium_carterae.1